MIVSTSEVLAVAYAWRRRSPRPISAPSLGSICAAPQPVTACLVARQWKPGARALSLGGGRGSGGREAKRGKGRKKLPRGRLSSPRGLARGRDEGCGSPVGCQFPTAPTLHAFFLGDSLRAEATQRTGGRQAGAHPVKTSEARDEVRYL